MTKTIRSFLAQRSAEYAVLTLVLAAVIGLLIALSADAQAPEERWVLPTYYPSPWGEYYNLACRQFVDYNDVNYKLDPSGTSRFRDLLIRYDGAEGGFLLMQSTGAAGRVLSNAGTPFFIDLNRDTGTSVYLRSLRTIAGIQMLGPNAGPPPLGTQIYDIAEGLPVADTVEAADVVCIDESSGALQRSDRAYDPRIVGVISTDPKVYLGPGEGKQPLALSGVVPCKASAENGPIVPGDVLVSASVSGYAMRASLERVEPGMVVGKALEPLESGKGTINILVNKQ